MRWLGVVLAGGVAVGCGGDGDGGAFDAAPGSTDQDAATGSATDGGPFADAGPDGGPASLTVTTSGEGGILISPPGTLCTGTCTETYPAGTTVQLTPSTAGCYRLASFSGACSGPEPCSLELDGDALVSAEFEAGASLSVTPPPIGLLESQDGRIACPPDCYEAFDCGDTVTLLPVDYAYFEWGDPCAGDCTCDLTMTESILMEPIYTEPTAQPVVQIRGGSIYPSALAVASSGDTFVYGWYGDAILLGLEWFVPRSSLDLFIVKYSPTGEYVWSWRIDDDGGDSVDALGAAVDPAGDLVVVGDFAGETDLGDGPLVSSEEDGPTAFVAKYDGDDGALVWKTLLTGGVYRAINDVATDAGGNVIITGQMRGRGLLGDTTVNSGPGSAVVVAKLAAADGDPLWARTFRGSDFAPRGLRVAVDGGGAIVIGGIYREPFDLGCVALPPAPGGYPYNPDVFIARLSPSGLCRWVKTFSGDGYEELKDIAASGSTIVVGGGFYDDVTIEGETRASAGLSDSFAVAFTSAGVHAWTRFFAGGRNDFVNAVGVLPDGRAVVAGAHQARLDLGGVDVCVANDDYDNAFAAIYDQAGDLVWSRDYGLERQLCCQDTEARAFAVAVADDGTLRLSGQFVGAVDVGSGRLEVAPLSDRDGFVVSLAPP